MREGSFSFRFRFCWHPIVIIVAVFLLRCDTLEAWTNGALRKTTTGTGNHRMIQRHKSLLPRNEAVAGSFFNPIPDPEPSDDISPTTSIPTGSTGRNDAEVEPNEEVLPVVPVSKALQPSTINGIPSEQVGLDLGMTLQAARQKDPITKKPYVGIGPKSLNDVTKPEYDDQGYTLYVDERTGTKARVFEALVNYPCLFTLKIVGANDDTFVQDVLHIVATTCEVVVDDGTDAVDSVATISSSSAAAAAASTSSTSSIEHSIKYNGKWASITVQAPVQSAQMLYQLYENVDRDPRVKFKF